jgi:prolipoprotein diacylglyceryltransferase
MFEAFQIGPFIIWTHLVFLLLAIWMASEFFFRLAASAGMSIQHFKDDAWWHVGASLLGGRVLAVLAEYRVYLRWEDPFRMFHVHDGNFSFLGAIVGIAIVLFIKRRHSRTTFLQWLDILTPAACFGLTFDWLGKFFAGQAYGTPTDVLWGVTYDSMSVRYAVPVHPVQLYYAMFFALLTFVLLIVRKHSQRAGAETLVGIVVASGMIFVLEFFRGDFGIPVFATKLDFALLILLFASLGFFALVELKLSQRTVVAAEFLATALIAVYLFIRPLLPLDTVGLRFSQLLAILALLGTIVYVLSHRRLHPHL